MLSLFSADLICTSVEEFNEKMPMPPIKELRERFPSTVVQ